MPIDKFHINDVQPIINPGTCTCPIDVNEPCSLTCEMHGDPEVVLQRDDDARYEEYLNSALVVIFQTFGPWFDNTQDSRMLESVRFT